MRFRPSVYGIVRRGDSVLLVKMSSSGKVFLPGGGVDLGERLVDCLRREIREETGIEVEIGQCLGCKDHFFYYDPLGEAYHSLIFVYLCKTESLRLAEGAEIEDVEVESAVWMAISELQEDMFQDHGAFILQLLEQGVISSK